MDGEVASAAPQTIGGFSHDSPTIQFLRAELVNMQNPDRQSFLKFATAVPRLVPDTQLIVTCKGKGGSWLPTAQTCTPQLNLSVYKRQADLGAALREAMANADADGGFHERAAGSDGNDAGNELAKHARGGQHAGRPTASLEGCDDSSI